MYKQGAPIDINGSEFWKTTNDFLPCAIVMFVQRLNRLLFFPLPRSVVGLVHAYLIFYWCFVQQSTSHAGKENFDRTKWSSLAFHFLCNNKYGYSIFLSIYSASFFIPLPRISRLVICFSVGLVAAALSVFCIFADVWERLPVGNVNAYNILRIKIKKNSKFSQKRRKGMP